MNRGMSNLYTTLWRTCALFGVTAISIALSGCAEPRVRQTEFAPPGFVNGTVVLAEVGGVTPRETMLHPAPENEWVHPSSVRQGLLSIGYTDADIVDGSVVVARSFCYTHSTGHCRTWGYYFAYLPPALRGKITFSMDEHDRKVRPQGDLLEIELREAPAKQLVAVVVAIYRKSGDWGSCRLEDFDAGNRYAMWIDCDGLEAEGWVRQHVPGSPSPPRGSPDRDAHEWIKLPRASPSG